VSAWSELPEKSKEDRKASVKRFRKNRKLRLLELKGGMKCTKCGYDKPIPDVYEFHHRDPTEKDPNWGKMIANNHRIESMIQEIEKCDLLCANCHREIHALTR
jgi:hypothetical protein